MVKIIIAIFIIGLVIVLAKYVLFHPRVNSVLTIIGIIAFAATQDATPYATLLLLSVADCIRDIVIAPKYYETDVAEECDKLYKIKSLVSLFTLGMARPVFLFIVGPCISFSVKSEIDGKLSAGEPLLIGEPYDLKAKNYYYKKHLDKLAGSGNIVSNQNTVNSETDIRHKRLEKLYPEKLIMKIVEAVSMDEASKKSKALRKLAEEKLADNNIRKSYAYISSDVFRKYPSAIAKAMSEKSFISSKDIPKLDKLQSLCCNAPLTMNGRNVGNDDWCEYFIIQALEPLVAKGEFVDETFSDKDPLDNHAYSYAKSEKKMASINADSNPLLALD